ncbi:NFU1 iron-sulfur cluster scaffold homolog, mitochondrial [uncultured Gammaproteobacteria bacterium]
MFIQTEETPNPATLKFLPGCPVLSQGGALEFATAAEASRSPLAERLFQINGVTGVFLGLDFISITKSGERDWYLLKPPVLGAIMDHFTSGRPILNAGTEDGAAEGAAVGDNAEIINQIIALLDERVRPVVARDGGDITFHSFEDGVVWLRMRGACSGCPSSTATLKAGVENMLRHFIPEVQEVRAVR